MKILTFNLIIILFLTFNVNYIQEKNFIVNEQIINIENLNNSQLINFDNKLKSDGNSISPFLFILFCLLSLISFSS